MTSLLRPLPLASGVYHQALGSQGARRHRTVAWLACHDVTAAGRHLRKLLTHYRRAEHIAQARYHLARDQRLDAIWGRVFDRAIQHAFGRSSTLFDYRVSAIGREEVSEHHKRVLRHCAYNATRHRDLARAHYRAAGLRREPTL